LPKKRIRQRIARAAGETACGPFLLPFGCLLVYCLLVAFLLPFNCLLLKAVANLPLFAVILAFSQKDRPVQAVRLRPSPPAAIMG
jgi:hypothetical protein